MRAIADLRKDYTRESLSEKDVSSNAIRQFDKWWSEAVAASIDEVTAMTLATASPDGIPSARIVLLKEYDDRGFTFFTNYNSYKGRQLEENPRACLVFFWKELERQVRITGVVEKVSEEESRAYFERRPLGSRLAALASPQSEVIETREWLEKKVEQLSGKFKEDAVPKPEYWGGYRVKPISVEFWQGRPNRLHDRLQYTLDENGGWKIERLAP
jgi:pyridoxamine 5'-phosphate oxidase